ncbi:O-succinylbenzoic acid--CoA ligase [Arthrobacter sp. yr096]|uniref:AMP-binding protein n=1 Tax=unclassified Arthrobacter TaxID=235627 RepID=UPI00089CE5D7|nr:MULTISPECIES: AMP-binding protein [unclassified Arthrobacter]SDX39996.1 O-succinylbenzoic acid--CoA ligase [Arthrobacter sp. cf158]SEI40818.1 O-succinylbenzoic acid--CoA ligase [Arthrobacter sp. yr096]
MDIDPILKALMAALHGEGPAVEIVVDEDGVPRAVPVETHVDEAAVVVRTSGSTGTPKATVLTVDALAASSVSTAMALRGEGQWLLALPLQYVAGVQVLVRSLYAGTRPWVMDQANGFTPEAFTAAAEELTDKIRFTSLVPTQLQRLLDSPAPETLAVLRRFNAILLGGAPASPDLLATAHAEGLTVVTTYGSAETCGGCVYDGEPLDGVEVRIGEGELEGRVLLGGDTVAAGYLDAARASKAAFFEEDGVRWYITGDLGELSDDGKLTVLGRADDVIITGGVKASAAYIQSKLEELDDVTAAFVAGVPSREWGQAVAAYVAVKDPSPDGIKGFTSRREAALGKLAPKTVLADKELLMLPNGKPDRMAMIDRLSELHQGQ